MTRYSPSARVVCTYLLATFTGSSLAYADTAPSGTGLDDSVLVDAAHQLDQQLRSLVLPFWYETGVDHPRGGYTLEPGSKQLVAQARMIWGFSHAHRHGLATSQHDYLAAARQGYVFLTEHFWDREHGGYYWMTDESGNVTNPYKMIYGQAFVIYALVEYYRASNDQEALDRALQQFLVLQQHAHDQRHGGWLEHFTPAWTPVMAPQENVLVEVPGYKSANSHLHLMEAFTELFQVSQDQRVHSALQESLRINRDHFYPRNPAQSVFHCHLDWTRVTDKSSMGLSYGHNVEFAWLMLRAEKALKEPLSWDYFYAYLDHALKNGFDHEEGGLYNAGIGDQPATDRDKVWWVQAELMAALTVSLQHQRREQDVDAMKRLLGFLSRKMIDPRDGIWVASVSADGKPKWDSKKNHWKAAYHDVRAIVMFVEAIDKSDEGFCVAYITSPHQYGERKIRVLLPDGIHPETRYRCLYVLPVEAGDECQFGDGLRECRRRNIHNRFQLICVAPTFSQLPWYADHPADPQMRQETYLISSVIPWIEAHYPVKPLRSARLLVGFSKSGWGAFSLLLRHPTLFSGAAAWDAPLMMERPDRYGMQPIFKSQENFERYQISRLLRKTPAEWRTETRLIHLGYGNFRDHHESTEALFNELGIRHLYRDGPRRTHDWHSGWLVQAVELLTSLDEDGGNCLDASGE